MASHTGKDGLIKIGLTTIGETKSWNIKESVEVKDATAQRDVARVKLLGFVSFDGTIEANFDPADIPQAGIALGSTVAFEFYPLGMTSGDPKWTGSGLITSIDHTVNFDDVISISFSFESNGTLLDKTGTVI